MELMLLFAAAILFLWLLASREKDVARIKRLESSVEHLYQAGSAVAHRVSALESRGSFAPPAPYRVAAEVAPLASPGWQPAPRPLVEPARRPTPEPVHRPASEPAPRSAAPPAPVVVTEARKTLPSAGPAGAPPRAIEPPPAGAIPADDPPADKPTIEWERWIGVRGAAALGAGILVIALFFFLRHSIAVGWLTLELRVALGAFVGVGCVAASQLRLQRTHRVLASWLTGAGVAGLYATIWAATTIAQMVGPVTAFALVVLVTAGCVALAIRNDSLPTALLGAAGGFAAPLMLSLDVERPIATIAYVLVLDVAMIVLAAKRRWWSLSALAMLLSAAYDAVWVATQDSPAGLLQVGVLTVFAGVFGGVPAFAMGDTSERDAPPSPLARLTRYGSVIVPLAFAAWLTQSPTSASNPAPIGALLILLTVLAAFIARVQREAALPFLAALGAPGVLAAWMARADVAANASGLGVLLVLLAGVHAGLVLLTRRDLRDDRQSPAHDDVAAIAVASAVVYLVFALGCTAAAGALAPDPWAAYLVTASALTGAVIFVAKVGAAPSLASLAAVAYPAVALAIGLPHTLDDTPAFFALGASLAVVAGLAVVGRRAADAERRELIAAARRGALASLLALAPTATTLDLGVFTALAFAFGFAALATKGDDESTYSTVLVLEAIAMVTMTWLSSQSVEPRAGWASIAVCGVFLAAPLLPALGLTAAASVPRGQVLGAAAFALGVGARFFTWEAELLGAGAAGLAAAFAVLYVALRRVTTSDAVRDQSAQWLGSAAIALASAAMGLTLRNELLTWGWAALGLALTWLACRKRSDALAVVGVVHLVIANARVFANPAVLGYHPRGPVPVLNWITPTFLLPALAAALGWALLSRLREPTGEKHALRVVPATLAFVTVFAWANVVVLDVFSAGATISFAAAAVQARDLSISLVWALFGTSLLVLGMRRGVRALRWSSLVLVLATAGKVFLVDLSQLEDLYRVASLAGLAISLLGISLLYQRFVFRPRAVAT
ncbi:MAG: DUF2339 domain-containing protein [Myxococcales bacterium]|nr:DUF2339 domain-containing protein [Myxococcales bacterium]